MWPYDKTHCVNSTQIQSFFWSVFSRIWTKYGDLDLFRKSPYSVQMRENTDQKKFRIWAIFTQWTAKPKPNLAVKNNKVLIQDSHDF